MTSPRTSRPGWRRCSAVSGDGGTGGPCWRRPPCWAPWRRDSPWGRGTGRTARIYWSQTDGELRYVIRLEHATTRPFQDAQLRCVPEGFILVRGSTSEIRGERSLAYRRGEDASFTLMQTQGEDLVGSKGTACQGSEVEVNGRLGLLVEEETDSTEKDLLWTDGPYIFALHGKGLSAEELLEIARNVTW